MDPFIGQIMPVAWNFAARGWAKCDGQLLPIQQNEALFSLLGTAYGGDGRTTFGLPDLRGRVPIHVGAGPGLSAYAVGQQGGLEAVALNDQELPSHRHTVACSSAQGNVGSPVGALPGAEIAAQDIWSNGPADAQMNADMIGSSGGGVAHENRPPYLAITWLIALVGIYPSRH